MNAASDALEERQAAMNTKEIDEHMLADLLLAALARTPEGGRQVDEDESWARMTREGYGFQRQGWKLHVSAAPLSARRAGRGRRDRAVPSTGRRCRSSG
jgi:hypothetical protein